MNGFVYLFVAQFLTSLMLAVIFQLAWRTVEPKPYTLSWSLLFFVATLQYSLNAIVDQLALTGLARELYWVVVNALALTVQGLAWAGYRQRAGRRGWSRGLVVYLLLLEALVVWFTMISFHQGLRMVLIPWSGTLVLGACAWTLLSPPQQRRPRAAERGAATLFILYALSNLAAGAAALLQGAGPDARYLEIYRQINFLAMPAMFTGLGLFTVLILADDLADRMRKLALTDELTGLLNRRGFEQTAAQALAQARRQARPLCIAMADIDHFKRVNDTHGHPAGDEALKLFSATLASQMRAGDIVGRIGGEEFAIVLPGADVAAGLEIIERLRLQLRQAKVISEWSAPFSITASFGLTPLGREHATLDAALRDADQALFGAKRAGRDRVEIQQATAGAA